MTLANNEIFYPPFRFSFVQIDVCRGSYPKERNFPFLKQLKLKSILTTTVKITNELSSFCIENSIKLIHVPIEKPKELSSLNNQKLTSIVEFIINSDNLPIFIHCLVLFIYLYYYIGWNINNWYDYLLFKKVAMLVNYKRIK